MPSTIILSDNGATSGSAGLKTSGGNDGVLLLQTTTSGGTPTTAISISNTQVVTYTNQPTYTGGTANGVLYLNGSKAVTSGTALVFDGTNLGLGVTPSAWGSYSGALDLKGGGGLGAFNNSTALFNNSYYNGTNYIYKASTGAAYYQMAGNSHQWYNAASGTAGNTVSFTQAMTLDASGNLGLGVTPSAWGGGVFKVIQLGGGGSNISATSGADEQMQIVSNAYYDGSAYKYVIGAHSSRYVQNNGAHQWDTAGSGTAGNAITFTQAMTLDASGDLQLGTTTGLSPSSGRRVFTLNGSSDSFLLLASGGTRRGGLYTQGTQLNVVNDTATLVFETNGSERARIDTSGNFLLGRTSTPGTASGLTLGANALLFLTSSSSPTSNIAGGFAMTGQISSPVCGRVFMGDNTGWQWEWGPYGVSGWVRRFYFTDGGAAYSTTGTWGTISDARLKENIVDATPKLSDVMRLRVRNFNFITEPNNKQLGFIAQEVEEIFPRAVDETRPDDDGNTTKSVKTTVLIPILVKAIQELKAEVDALKGQA